MSWFRVDDQFHRHPKAHAAGNAALGLWLLLGSVAADIGRNGEVPMRVALNYGTRRQLDRLIEVGLLDRRPTSVVVHDMIGHRDPVTDAERARRYRQRLKAVTERDGERDGGSVTHPSRRPSRREDRRPTTDSWVSKPDDDDSVQTAAAVTKRDGQSSSSSEDSIIQIAAHAIALEVDKQGNRRYIAGVERNLRAERADEIAKLGAELDPIEAAGIVCGSMTLARLAADAIAHTNRDANGPAT